MINDLMTLINIRFFRKVFFVFSALLIFSCKKNQLGGSSTIQGQVAHHSLAIANSTVYIKFNTKEFPGSDIKTYDANVKTNEKGEFSIKCYKGNYYLYAVGFDKGISENVFGGIPIRIRDREVLDVEVAVTE